jgi:hypothetical protein
MQNQDCPYYGRDGECWKYSDEHTTEYCALGPCNEIFESLVFEEERQIKIEIKTNEKRGELNGQKEQI